MSKRYLVTLTEEERATLGQRVATGRGPARELGHARILLEADAGSAGPAWTDGDIAEALDISVSTVERGAADADAWREVRALVHDR